MLSGNAIARAAVLAGLPPVESFVVSCVRAAFLVVSCTVGAPGTAAAMPRHVDVVLAPGKVHEDCFTLRLGQQVRYNFKLDQAGAFNLHYHSGSKVISPLQSDSVTEQTGDHVATVAQEYCLMWTNIQKRSTKLGYEFIVVEPGITKP